MLAIRRFLQVIATGYILMFFSENLFWARLRPDNSVSDWLATWTAYSLAAYIFLWIISYFRIRSFWALFLAGAVFGWTIEGIIETTTYESLPLQISWTGLAWHASISAMVGWYAIRMALQKKSALHTLRIASLIGFCYGIWAIYWWIEPDDGGKATIAEFAAYSLVATILSLLAYRLYNWAAVENYTPGLPGRIIVGLITLLYFVFVTIKAAPVALPILPGLLLLTYITLRRNKEIETEDSILSEKPKPVAIWNYLALFAIPLIAIAFYSIAYYANLRWYTNWVLYIITTPLGFILFAVSIYKIMKKRPTDSCPDLSSDYQI